MSGDYKYDIQLKAEELAEHEYEISFYDLLPDEQGRIYIKASQVYWDSLYDAADLRKHE